MSMQSILPQECFFYEGQWNELIMNAFIDILLDEKALGNWKVDGNNTHSLQIALEFVNVVLDKEFLWDDALTRCSMLRKCYLTFKAMQEIEGVWWDRKINHVYALSSLWIDMIKNNSFVKAFYHKGDVSFDKLKALFGSPHDLSNEVINVSSDEPSSNAPNSVLAPLLIVESDDEEVDSPGIEGRKPPRKYLFKSGQFSETRALINLESNTLTIIHSGHEGSPTTHPTTTNLHVVIKKEDSSCASCSPLKTTKSPSGK